MPVMSPPHHAMTRRLLILCFLTWVGVSRVLLAADSSQQFLSAYQAYQQGERAERDGRTSEALKSYRYAESLLQTISANDPSWQKAVVEYRLKKTQDGLSRLQASQGSSDQAGESAVAPTFADGTDGSVAVPSQSGPSITISAPSGASLKSGASTAATSEVRRLKKLVDSLKSELQSVKDAATAEKSRSDDLNKTQWTKEMSDLRQQLTQAKDRIAELGDKLHQRDSWEKDLKDLQEKLNDALADKASAEEDFQKREKKMTDASAQLSKQLAEANAKVSSVNEGTSALQQQLAESKVHLAQAEKAANEATQKMNAAISAAQADRAVQDEDHQRLESKLAEQSKQVITLQERLKAGEDLQKQVDLDRESLKQLQAKLDDAGNASKNEEAKNQELTAKIQDLSAKLSESQKQIVVLAPFREKVAQLQQELLGLKKETTASKQTIAELDKNASKREADMAALGEDRDKLVAEVQRLGEAAKEASKVKGLESQAEELEKSVATLKQQLETSTKEAEATKARLAESERKTKDATQKLAAASSASQADRAVLEEERTRLESKLTASAKQMEALGNQLKADAYLKKQDEDLRAKLADNAKAQQEADAKIAMLQHDALALREENQRKMEASKSLKDLLESQNASLSQQLKDALGRVSALIDKNPQTADMQDQLSKLQLQLNDNAKKYAESQKAQAALIASRPEQEKLLKQREADLAVAQEQEEKLKADLEASNKKITELQQQATHGQDLLKQLQDQLADLTAKISTGEKTDEALRKEAEQLKAEVASSKEKLASLQGDSDKAQELKQQLADKESELARLKKKKSAKGALVDAKTAEENTVLRGIILRQVKEEAKRAQARRLMEEEIKRLNVQSGTLSEQVGILSAPVMVLSPEERSLFKADQLVVVDEGNGPMQASVSAPSTQMKNSAANSASTDGMSPPTGSTNAPSNAGNSTNSTGDTNKEIAWQGKFKECLSRAKDEFDRQDYLQSEGSFKEALSYSPDDYFALSNLGVVEFQLGKLKEAEEFLSKATQKKSDSSFALTTLGIVNYRQEHLDAAEKTLRKAIGVNDQDFTAHNYLGIVLAASGKGKEGESEIMRAIEINKNYADAHFNLAVIYATGKPPSKMMAKKHYAKALELGAPPDASLERLVQ